MEKQKLNILTKELMDKSDIIRFVCGPDNKVFADLSESLPGKGMWVKADKESLQEVIDKKIFNKISEINCQLGDNFVEEVSLLLKKRVLDMISISKKAGKLTLGFDKVIDKIKVYEIVLIASDSGEDGKNKILHKIGKNTIIVDKFTGAELQIALGQDTVVVYAGVNFSQIAEKIIIDYNKYLHFI